ncbi:MAG: ribonuclease HII [Tissierellia bacterium]|nr:ribonuclease HII [Tissierellia bacterium]
MTFINYEEQFYEKNYQWIVGIDEVGRGCLFGDVVACAIIMPRRDPIEGIDDSKKLSERKRLSLYQKILERQQAVGIGRVDNYTIDQINIRQATHLAMISAIENLRTPDGKKILPDFLLIDAETINTDIDQQAIIKGDENCYSIACASIVAKVYRDMLCKKWELEYPGYGIGKHKGYATKYHREILKAYGPSDMHRKSFLKNMDKW